MSIGYPGPVLHNRPAAEAAQPRRGWVGFDFAKAFAPPRAQVVNDAAMQALGSYKGGKMLFLGFGTGLGTTLIVDGVVEPMELGHLPYRKATYEDYVGERALERLGKKKWRKHVADVIARLTAALEPDDVVLGGGNAKKLTRPAAALPARRQRQRVPRRLPAVGNAGAAQAARAAQVRASDARSVEGVPRAATARKRACARMT